MLHHVFMIQRRIYVVIFDSRNFFWIRFDYNFKVCTTNYETHHFTSHFCDGPKNRTSFLLRHRLINTLICSPWLLLRILRRFLFPDSTLCWFYRCVGVVRISCCCCYYRGVRAQDFNSHQMSWLFHACGFLTSHRLLSADLFSFFLYFFYALSIHVQVDMSIQAHTYAHPAATINQTTIQR